MSQNRSQDGFIHLHNHTNFSLLDGATRIEQLMERCCELNMGAVAMTDHGNMFGAIQFYQSARKHGLKPIIGMEAYLAPGSRTDRVSRRRGDSSSHLLLLAKDADGYRNLMKLSSVGYLEGFYYKPRIDRETLATHAKGLIGTTGCLSSEVCRHLMNGDAEAARRVTGELVDILGAENFYVELQDQGLEEQHRINPDLMRIAAEFRLPLVGTNDCHYLRREDASAHDVLLCIQTGKGINDPNRMKFPNEQFYLKSQEEMAQVFADVPEALASTAEIASRCDLEIDFGTMHLPRFPVPDGCTLEGYFEQVVREGFDRRMRALGEGGRWRGRQPLGDYEQRLEYEISVIRQMGFPGYFLIVWDFIRFAREQGIPVGPGRGSAAGSLVAYSLDITDVDPIDYGLVFERFLNPERISMPDIDIDFCMRRRGEVISYVANKYGHDKVAHIITFGTMAAKAAIRDVGRALEMPFGDVDRIAKLIPAELDATIAGALKSEAKLREAIDDDPQVGRLVEFAEQLEGQVRHASTHAAGVVISDEPLTEYLPLYKPPGGNGADGEQLVATQFPMNHVEAIGLLKMDFLGLRTLTLVHDCFASISRERGSKFDAGDIPLTDKKTYRLFAQGATSGIFQFESSGMRDALRKLKPTRLNDLIAMNALYRPGPIRGGMIDMYIERKHDPSTVVYQLPQLEEALEETYGVIVYQEQVMKIASTLAGFTLGEADVLRKAMGKKKPEVMDSMREKFLDGAEAKGVSRQKARPTWDMIVEFAGYGFNKSHSAAYALLAYQTGYLKTNYPVHFMAAVLTNEQNNTDKVVQYTNECRGMGIRVLPPAVNESDVHFTPVAGSIRFGLAAIKGVGEGAVRGILEARADVGPYRSLAHFCEAVDTSRGINKRTIESLIKGGAMDSLVDHSDEIPPGMARAILFAQLDGAVEHGQRAQKDKSSGQTSLFASLGGAPSVEASLPMPPLPDCESWSEREVLNAEKEALGFYVTGHPLQRYEDEIERLADTNTRELGTASSRTEVTLGGMISSIRSLKTRKGEAMAVLQIEDAEGQAEVVVFPKAYRKCYELLIADAPLLFCGRPDPSEDSPKLIANTITTFAAADRRQQRKEASAVDIVVDLSRSAAGTAEALCAVLERHRGNIPVSVRLLHSAPDGFRAHVAPNRFLCVDPTSGLVQELEALLGDGSVRLRT